MPTCSTTSIPGPKSCGGIFDFEGKRNRLNEVVQLAEDPAIWNDAKRAQDLGRERKQLESVVATLEKLDQGLRDARDLFAMARAENDDAALNAIAEDIADMEKIVAGMEFRRMFSNPMDPNNCVSPFSTLVRRSLMRDWSST